MGRRQAGQKPNARFRRAWIGFDLWGAAEIGVYIEIERWHDTVLPQCMADTTLR